MEGRATARFVRVSPRKARQVVDQIRGKGVEEAYAILQFTQHRPAKPILKVLRSAISNAAGQETGLSLDPSEFVVDEAYVNEGPRLKRVMPRAMGRAYLIRKRTSHVTIVVRSRGG